jgi:LytS/YehU family sensor histidine kinase
VLALLLLPCVTVAEQVTRGRLAAWAAFAIAGLGCAALAFAGVAHFLMPWLFEVPGWTPTRVGVMLPPFMMTGLFASLGYMHWRDATKRAGVLRSVQLDHARFAREAYEARLVALQARVEPRFLFETLADAERLYECDNELGARVLDDLIVHLRAALPAIEATSSTLAVEMDLVRTWLDIVRVRSGDTVLLAMPPVDAPGDARMPPMVLLPLVQHAVGSVTACASAVLVSAAVNEARLRVTIVGPAGALASFEGSGGIEDVRERVLAVYGDQATLALRSALGERRQAILEIPYERTHGCPG